MDFVSFLKRFPTCPLCKAETGKDPLLPNEVGCIECKDFLYLVEPGYEDCISLVMQAYRLSVCFYPESQCLDWGWNAEAGAKHRVYSMKLSAVKAYALLQHPFECEKFISLQSPLTRYRWSYPGTNSPVK